MWNEMILVSLVGALISLDRTAAFQVMISRPLAAGPLTGLVLGQTVVGIWTGFFLELLWISRPPLGGQIPPHECLGTVVITSGLILAGPVLGEPDRSAIILGILLGLPVARLGSIIEDLLRRINNIMEQKAQIAVQAGRSGQLVWLNLAGLSVQFMANLILILVLLPVFIIIIKGLYPVLPVRIIYSLDMMSLILPIVGVAAALSNINAKGSWITFILMCYGALIFFYI